MNYQILRLKSVKIVLTFFLLWLTTLFDSEIENFLAYFFILSLGILHGSNDLKLLGSHNNFKTTSYKKMLFSYIGMVAVIFVTFLWVPKIGLVLFILVSSYHFGEQHLSEKLIVLNKRKIIVYVLYGLLIFFMIFYTNFNDVSIIVHDTVNIFIPQNFYKYALLVLLLLFCIVVLLFRNVDVSIRSILEEAVYIVLFFILFMNATLLWSFAIYFIVWHSIPSLKDQILMLYGNVSFRSILTYIKDSFFYWAVSIVGITVLTIITKEDERLFNELFVALLAAITIPHVIILGKLHEKHD